MCERPRRTTAPPPPSTCETAALLATSHTTTASASSLAARRANAERGTRVVVPSVATYGRRKVHVGSSARSTSRSVLPKSVAFPWCGATHRSSASAVVGRRCASYRRTNHSMARAVSSGRSTSASEQRRSVFATRASASRFASASDASRSNPDAPAANSDATSSSPNRGSIPRSSARTLSTAFSCTVVDGTSAASRPSANTIVGVLERWLVPCRSEWPCRAE